MITVKLEHFELAAKEIGKNGDNDTLPFDLDIRFCKDKYKNLAKLAFEFYSRKRNNSNQKISIQELNITSERLITTSGPSGFRVVTKILFFGIYI